VSYAIFKQPDDLFAVWSPLVDDFIHWDCTIDDVKQIWQEEYGRSGQKSLAKEMDFAKSLHPGYESFNTRIVWREYVHAHHELTNMDSDYQAWLAKWKTPEIEAQLAEVKYGPDIDG
jgi:hypothetical protein